MDYKKALADHPTATEIHVNEKGQYLFCPKKGVPDSFGEYETFQKESVNDSSLGDLKTGGGETQNSETKTKKKK